MRSIIQNYKPGSSPGTAETTEFSPQQIGNYFNTELNIIKYQITDYKQFWVILTLPKTAESNVIYLRHLSKFMIGRGF
jgi:hypothetical protein